MTPMTLSAPHHEAPPSPRALHEARMGVESVEELTARRHALVSENAKREALYGSGTWKFHRDRLEALIAIEKRRELATEGAKVTDKIVAEQVLTDPRMKAFMDATEDEMAEYHISADAIQAVNDTLLRDAAVARHTAAEARLG